MNASATLPKSNFNKNAKPHWSAKVKESYTRALRLRNEWFKAGRPKDHSTHFLAYKEAKTAFRRTERRARESHDNSIFDQLNRAEEVDYKTFWKLLRQKKWETFNYCSKIVVGDKGFENTNVAEGFKEYFAQVFDYVNTDDLLYDTLNKELVHYMNTESSPLLKTLTRQFSIEEVEKAVHSLSKRKSPAHDGILKEHIIHAGHSVVKMLRILFNAILKYEKVPTQWQTSILIPIYKGKGKSRSDPESYRPVSLIPCFSKLFEKLLLSRVNTYISATKIEFPCRQQQGSQKQLSCITTSFNLQETVYYNVERSSDVYVASMDQKGAFDSVRHTLLLLKLGRLGFVGKFLRIIKAESTGLQCVVRYSNMTSLPFNVVRGVRQGGVFSTFLYLVYINELVSLLQDSDLGCKIMSISVSNPTFADDISMLSLSPLNLQKMVDIVYNYCQTWKIKINVSKSNVIFFNTKRNIPKTGIMFGNHFLIQVKTMLHLGIIHESSLTISRRIDNRIQKARNALFAMAGQGLHPEGINPLVSASLYAKIVRPTLLYGAELWNNMSVKDGQSLAIFQHFFAKKSSGV